MPKGYCRIFLASAVTVLTVTSSADAQERVALRTDAILYGDNTEFFNPFREGATLLGTAARVAIDVDLNRSVTFSGGVFLNHYFGSDRIAEIWRPIIKLALQSKHQRFIIGTLDTPERTNVLGPDRTGPHGLLPALQRETLAFERPYEAGLQWKMHYPGFRQDTWINWQQTNTSEERERFDVGMNGRLPLVNKLAMSLAYQFHMVHEGGQLFASGPVRDSWAVGPGLIVEPKVWFFDRTMVDVYALFSQHVPDRSRLQDSKAGHGLFARISAEKNGWRGHLIFWDACNWIKEEGDTNYGAMREDGTRFNNRRHYGEVGIAKMFHPAKGVEIEGSARLHRIERSYDYSYRVLTHLNLNFPTWTRR